MPILSPIGAATSAAFGLPKSAGSTGDPYYNYVTMLLNGDGTNGAQNNTFLDSSTNNFTITRVGNVTQGSFTPFGSLWSNYLNGSSNLSTSTNTSLVLSGDFTIEGWYYWTSFSSYQTLFALYTNNAYVQSTSSGGSSFSTDGAFGLGTIISGASLGTWYHVAISRSGSTLSAFVNGVRTATTTNSNSIGNSSSTLIVGAQNTSQWYFNGYISNFRVVKGTAVYNPSSSTCTVPTAPLTAISGTSLLTCQSNRFIDNSSSAFSLTLNGAPSVQRFSPFNPTESYDTATIGGSGYFDGSGDKLTLANNGAFDCGTGNDFCMEMWAYATYSTNAQHYWSSHQGGQANGFYFSNSTGAGRYPSLQIYSGGGGGGGVSSNTLMNLNEWVHICVTRQSGRMRIFLNGVLRGTTTNTYQVNTDGHLLGINGGDNFVGDAGWYGGGRYINGSVPTSYQTSSTTLGSQVFTPPTTPFTTTSQGATSGDVKVLVKFTNAGIPDLAMMNDLETVGNAQVSTSVKKFGTGSLYFDGTGDWLASAPNPLYTVNGDFTIECWVYTTTTSGLQGVASYSNPSTGWSGWQFSIYNQEVIYENLTGSSGSGTIRTGGAGGITANTWIHVAVVRQSGTVYLYVNGVSLASGSSSGSYTSSGSLLGIGTDRTKNSSWYSGYIDDFRFTNGLARYPNGTTFTPPTAALPTF